MNNLDKTFDKFTSHFKKVLVTAQELAISMRNKTVEPLHILYGITVEKGCIGADMLAKNKFTIEQAKDILGIINDAKNYQASGLPALSTTTQKIIEGSVATAFDHGHRYIGTEHLLDALIDSNDNNLIKFFESKSINPKMLSNNIKGILKSTSKFPDIAGFDNNNTDSGLGMDNELEKILSNQKENNESSLSTYTIDLTDEKIQEDIDPVIGRDMEVERLIQILSRRTKNNPILIGDPGVGKTAIIEGLAKRIAESNVPDVLINKRILSLDLGATIAGTIYRGEFENRIKKIINEVKNNPNIILFVDEIHNLIGAGSAAGSLDAANIIKPELARGKLRCIGATTQEEFKKHIESDPAFERRFQPIQVKESTRLETIDILKGLRKNYEKYHKIKITDEAIEAAVDLSIRFMQDKFLPDKAIDLIDEASSKLKVANTKDGRAKIIKNYENKLKKLNQAKDEAIKQQQFAHALALKEKENEYLTKLEELKKAVDKGSNKILGTLTRENITEVVSHISGVPVKDLALDEKQRLLDLEKELQKYIIGQDEALTAIARSVRRSRTGIGNPNRPIGSFIFLGPSGVGKTETAKVLAKEFFGREDALIRIDMSEFSESFNISKLLGAPAGYVGYKEQGKLTDSVKHQPYSVVLFDEIEKAHPDVYNLLLPILEDGQLTDATGKVINFKNTIIIMTSNIGLQEFNHQAQLGFESELGADKKVEHDFVELSKKIEDGLGDYFRPEFLNRIDANIIFKPLTKESLLKIAKIQMNDLLKRLLSQKLRAQITSKTFNWLVDKGFAPEQGARGIRRAIQDFVEEPLANKLLSEEITENKIIKIGISRDKITIE